MISGSFYARPSKLDTYIIYVRFYSNREKIMFSTEVVCLRKDWDELKGKVKSSDKDHKNKNMILGNVTAKVNDILVKYKLREKKVTKDLFFREYKRPTSLMTFFDYVEDFQKHYKNTLELSTLMTHKAVIAKLKEYKPNLYLDDVTTAFLVDYASYLIKNKNNKPSTVMKNMAVIKKYIRAAFTDGYIIKNPYDDFKIRKIKSVPKFLTEDELKLLIDFYKSGQYDETTQKSLQIFLFMCFSSLHIGDAKLIKIEQINKNTLSYTRKKIKRIRSEATIVPVSKSLKWILSEIVGFRKTGFVFTNWITDQEINRCLKDVAIKCNIDKKISNSYGRHTFATIYLSNTNDLNSLKDIMGHSDISMTLIYAHVLEQNKQRGISCFDVFSNNSDDEE